MGIRISGLVRIAVVGTLSLALSGCYGWWGYHHHPYGGRGYYGGPHPGPGPGAGYYH